MRRLRLADATDSEVLAFDLGPHLHTERLARVVELHRALGSTNQRAAELGRQGAATGTLVVALEQTAGRGQRGRRWLSPPGGLYASFLVRPELEPRSAPALTLAVGVALAEALSTLCPVPLGIKWPNDLWVAQGPHRGKKVAGILVEASLGEKLEHAVIGIGVNLREIEKPLELQPFATSLEALGAAISLDRLAATIANQLEPRLLELEFRGPQDLLKAWRDRALGLGEPAELDTGETSILGPLMGLAADGALLLGGHPPQHHGTLHLPSYRQKKAPSS